MENQGMTKKLQIPVTPELAAALAQVGSNRKKSAYVRNALTAALRRDGYALPGPDDAVAVPVINRTEELALKIAALMADGVK